MHNREKERKWAVRERMPRCLRSTTQAPLCAGTCSLQCVREWQWPTNTGVTTKQQKQKHSCGLMRWLSPAKGGSRGGSERGTNCVLTGEAKVDARLQGENCDCVCVCVCVCRCMQKQVASNEKAIGFDLRNHFKTGRVAGGEPSGRGRGSLRDNADKGRSL